MTPPTYTLHEARRVALALADEPAYEATGVYIYRVSPRQFTVSNLLTVKGDLRMIINTVQAREGWYHRYKPEWYTP